MTYLIRAWADIHGTRSAITLFATAAVGSMLLGHATMTNMGGFTFPRPVSALLLLPALAGCGIALACENSAKLNLPSPPRVVVSRAIWLGCTAITGMASATVFGPQNLDVSTGAVIRNVLLYSAFGLAAVQLGLPDLAWLPIAAYTVAAMTFGYPPHTGTYYWWAVIMEAQSASNLWIGVAAFVITGATYVTRSKLQSRR